ncbi:MOSC domain-containing protein [Brevibacillus ruminantium]|uniref:MOSC domain-containing protein n=1 Tax=Brevibacillus ruminantium TaxID=2950604 RepID=A0ABY4WHQ1_9BACL|nr:MOSC domain-containing protein [Brevibacillus ruminantium]USG64864.1 MOSC domain-containing protein [Brevibacillus ruminantium]
MRRIGKIGSIYRHPVKAMRGEQLQTSKVDAFGLYGDRSHAFLDESRNGKYLSADILPALLGYSAKLLGDSGEEAYPEVRITAPDGDEYEWGDALFASVARTANRQITPLRSTPQEGGKNWEDHILLVTDASLRELARLIGWESIDPRRFRGNLVIVLDEDVPFAEDEWLGKQLQVNDIVLQVNKHCERCNYVNIDPDTLELHPAVLKTCVKRHDNHFGVYASVVRQGQVSEGDGVFLLETKG